MAQLESYNTQTANSWKQVFVPGAAQVVLYAVASVVLLGVLNIGTLWDYVNSEAGVTAETANSLLQNRLDQTNSFIDGLFGGRVASILFWAALGCFVYMLFWLAQNTYINVRNDLEAEKYKHPGSFNRSSYWRSVASAKIFFACAALMGAFFTYLAFTIILPLASRLFFAAIFDFHLSTSLVRLGLAILITTLVIYVFSIVWRAIRSSWRWITSNL